MALVHRASGSSLCFPLLSLCVTLARDFMKKPLRIGLIGYGFMGRTHSNAFRKVGNFFDLEYEPIMQAVCARDEVKSKAFADQWGWKSVECDWRKLVERDD